MDDRQHDRNMTRGQGFSLVELLVSMVLVALVLGGALTMFNYTNKLSRQQLHQSDLQQSARVSQRELLGTIRMAGRGGLSGFHVPGFSAASGPASDTPAISVRNNVPGAQQNLVIGNPSSPLVALETDVLTVRGHFTSPPLFVRSTDPSTHVLNAEGGVITISSRSPGGIPQDLSALVDAVDDERSDALLITSSLSDLDLWRRGARLDELERGRLRPRSGGASVRPSRSPTRTRGAPTPTSTGCSRPMACFPTGA